MFETLQRIKVADRKDITFGRVVAAIWRRIVNTPQQFVFFLPLGFYKNNRNKLHKVR